MNERGYLDPVARRVDILFQRSAKSLIKLYGESDSFYQTRMMKSTYTEFSANSELHCDALLLPYRSNYHIPEGGFFEHWAYTKELNPVLLADHYKPILVGYRDHALLPIYPFKKTFPVKSYTGNFYYMGMLNPHYGHFIQESLTRYWAALHNPGLIDKRTKFVFHVMANSSESLLDEIYSKNIHQYLAALGISRDKVIFVRGASSFEKIIIPEPAIAISDGNCYLSSKAKDVWTLLNEKMSRAVPIDQVQRPKKIYISRSAVKNPIQGRFLVNEDDLEKRLKKRGYTIVIPENHDQCEMQAILSEVEVIIGAPGSGLQNSFFIPSSAITIGLTTEAIVKINPGLNHQIHTDKICNHKTHAYIAASTSEKSGDMAWRVNIKDIENTLDDLGV